VHEKGLACGARQNEGEGGWWRSRIVVTDLTGGVDDVALILCALVVNVLGEGAFDGGVIGLDKVVVNELDDQG
jgi:hypothetical protein